MSIIIIIITIARDRRETCDVVAMTVLNRALPHCVGTDVRLPECISGLSHVSRVLSRGRFQGGREDNPGRASIARLRVGWSGESLGLTMMIDIIQLYSNTWFLYRIMSIVKVILEKKHEPMSLMSLIKDMRDSTSCISCSHWVMFIMFIMQSCSSLSHVPHAAMSIMYLMQQCLSFNHVPHAAMSIMSLMQLCPSCPSCSYVHHVPHSAMSIMSLMQLCPSCPSCSYVHHAPHAAMSTIQPCPSCST